MVSGVSSTPVTSVTSKDVALTDADVGEVEVDKEGCVCSSPFAALARVSGVGADALGSSPALDVIDRPEVVEVTEMAEVAEVAEVDPGTWTGRNFPNSKKRCLSSTLASHAGFLRSNVKTNESPYPKKLPTGLFGTHASGTNAPKTVPLESRITSRVGDWLCARRRRVSRLAPCSRRENSRFQACCCSVSGSACSKSENCRAERMLELVCRVAKRTRGNSAGSTGGGIDTTLGLGFAEPSGTEAVEVVVPGAEG